MQLHGTFKYRIKKRVSKGVNYRMFRAAIRDTDKDASGRRPASCRLVPYLCCMLPPWGVNCLHSVFYTEIVRRGSTLDKMSMTSCTNTDISTYSLQYECIGGTGGGDSICGLEGGPGVPYQYWRRYRRRRRRYALRCEDGRCPEMHVRMGEDNIMP